MKKLTRLMIFLLAVSLLLTGCSSGQTTPTAGTPQLTGRAKRLYEDRHLIVALDGEGRSLDPGASCDGVSGSIAPHMYDGLFGFDETGNLTNLLCEEYTVSEDMLVYTFNMRKDAVWADGVPITADQVKYAMLRTLNTELNVNHVKYLFFIENGEEAFRGEVGHDEVAVEVLDEHTLQITLKAPCLYFPQLLACAVFWPLRPDFAPEKDLTWGYDPNIAIASSAYSLESYRMNDRVVLRKNENYPGADEVFFEKITFFFMSDMQSQINAYNAEEIDIATRVPTDIRANPLYANSPDLIDVPIIVNYYITMSQNENAPDVLKDENVRRALSYAINREELCAILNGTERPLYGLVPPRIMNPETHRDFREEGGNLTKYDIEEAKRLLAEAGYPNGEGFPTLTYITNPSQRHEDTAQVIQNMWKEIGVNIDLQLLEWGIFLTTRNRTTGSFEVARHAGAADYFDPDTYLGVYVANDPSNEAWIDDPEYDRLYYAAQNELDVAKRMQLMHDAERQLIQEKNWLIPLFSYGNPHLIAPGITGYRFDPTGTVIYHNASYTPPAQ